MRFLPSSRTRPRLRRNEWCLLTLSLLALVLLLSPPERLQRINHLVQDAALRLPQRRPPPRRQRFPLVAGAAPPRRRGRTGAAWAYCWR